MLSAGLADHTIKLSKILVEKQISMHVFSTILYSIIYKSQGLQEQKFRYMFHPKREPHQFLNIEIIACPNFQLLSNSIYNGLSIDKHPFYNGLSVDIECFLPTLPRQSWFVDKH